MRAVLWTIAVVPVSLDARLMTYADLRSSRTGQTLFVVVVDAIDLPGSAFAWRRILQAVKPYLGELSAPEKTWKRLVRWGVVDSGSR